MTREEQQEQEQTPLQSVKDSCRRLRKEWGGMMQGADAIFFEMLSSLQAQDAALTAEQTEVQLLKREIKSLRKSLSQTAHEQEQKLLAERRLAEEVRLGVSNQLGEVKQLQNGLETHLAKMRDSIEKIKNSMQPESANSVQLLKLSNDVLEDSLEQLESKISLPLERDDPGSSKLLSVSPFSHLDRLNSEKNNGPSDKSFEQHLLRPKLEELQGWEKEDLEWRLKATGSIISVNHSRPERFQADCVSIKTEFDEERDIYLKDKHARKLVCNISSVEDDTDTLDDIKLSERLQVLLQHLIKERCMEKDDEASPEVCLYKKHKFVRLGGDSGTAKRKWEVPVEIALQEDAPGLLEKLQERGLLEDVTIFGASHEDDWGKHDEQFKDLECIVKKIWGSTGLLRMPHVIRQHTQGLGKGSLYCLSCLASLIEQAKSLRQRKWPVEWGWCRDLQAFIFVFDKHNRVVLERPEYGNATYFFELVQFLPVKWQVFRLIHVLSVIAFGKTALLENKPLELGSELTTEESKILEGFGWTAGTGLGSFLNFCDRVVHDVKEDNTLEWRQKIGKCLMDGYDKGRIMMPTLPPEFLKSSNTIELEAGIKSDILLST